MIHTIATISTIFIILEHIYILWVEMFAWETTGKRIFSSSLPASLFEPTKKMAANQGLYNGFLAAGLIWSFLITDLLWAEHIRMFFLGCIAVAGIYGAVTASRKIFVLQALPDLISLFLLLIS